MQQVAEPKTLEELYELTELLGANAEIHCLLDDIGTSKKLIVDALGQFVSVHEYAKYDPTFEPETIDELREIISINMNVQVRPEFELEFERWVGDIVMLLATGAIDLNEYIENRGLLGE